MPAFRRVLVTGGAGFIGSHLVDQLLSAGYQVRVFDNLEPQVHGERDSPPDYLSREVDFVRGDILDRAALLKALRDCDAIVHLAAMVGVGQSQYDIFRYTHVNTSGTAQLLDLIVNKKLPIGRLLVASSMSIYGEGLYRRPSDGLLISPIPRPESQMAQGDYEVRDTDTAEALEAVPTPESKPLHCTSIYALSKKDQEEYCLAMGRVHGISTAALRFFNVYGPRQSLSNPYTGAAAIFASRIKNNNRPLIYEDGGQSRDFVDVRDVVSAIQFALENPDACDRPYNVCSGRSTPIAEIAEVLAKLMGKDGLHPEIVGKFRAGDIRHCFGDPQALKALGWSASISLEDGMRYLVEWTETAEAVDKVDQAHQELVAKGLVRGS